MQICCESLLKTSPEASIVSINRSITSAADVQSVFLSLTNLPSVYIKLHISFKVHPASTCF